MVKVKQYSGEEGNQGVTQKIYTEVEHSSGVRAYGGDDGELIIEKSGGTMIAGYAPGHWASFTVDS